MSCSWCQSLVVDENKVAYTKSVRVIKLLKLDMLEKEKKKNGGQQKEKKRKKTWRSVSDRMRHVNCNWTGDDYSCTIDRMVWPWSWPLPSFNMGLVVVHMLQSWKEIAACNVAGMAGSQERQRCRRRCGKSTPGWMEHPWPLWSFCMECSGLDFCFGHASFGCYTPVLGAGFVF